MSKLFYKLSDYQSHIPTIQWYISLNRFETPSEQITQIAQITGVPILVIASFYKRLIPSPEIDKTISLLMDFYNAEVI